jgi:apolipoprotein D and lipocalin family protein
MTLRPSLVFVTSAVLVTILFMAVKDGYADSELPPVKPVAHVDLARYMGVWYEIARVDHFFQKGCIKSTASYTMLPNGEVEVVNRCVNGKNGRLREAKGRAWSVDPEGNARLKVSFFWPFRSDFWIIDIGKEYEYTVVGAPNRNYLWIMARQPVMDESVYERILGKLTLQGFAVDQLVR